MNDLFNDVHHKSERSRKIKEMEEKVKKLVKARMGVTDEEKPDVTT